MASSMAFEREKRVATSGDEGIDLDLEREKAARLKKKLAADAAAKTPGKRTLVDQVAPPPEPLAVVTYQGRAMQEVLGAMGAVARGERNGVLDPATGVTSAMLQVAERRTHSLMRRAQDHGEIDAEDPAVEESLARMGGGQALPEEVRKRMEAEFGVSFERVRIHTDGVAANAAKAIHAE